MTEENTSWKYCHILSSRKNSATEPCGHSSPSCTPDVSVLHPSLLHTGPVMMTTNEEDKQSYSPFSGGHEVLWRTAPEEKSMKAASEREEKYDSENNITMIQGKDNPTATLNVSASKFDIKFRISSSHDRRNLDRMIIRRLSSFCEKEEIRGSLLKVLAEKGISRDIAVERLTRIAGLREMAKGRSEKSNNPTRHLFTEEINIILSDPVERILLKMNLVELQDALANGEIKKINNKNRQIYLSAIRDYLGYLEHFTPE